ncbi:hypothetical protein D3C73_780470 [compost metagenome]
MQPSITLHPFEEGGEGLLLQQRSQELVLVRVQPPHAAQVTRIAAAQHEGGKRALFERPRRVRLEQPLRGSKGIVQRVRQHDVADAQAAQHRLTEGAEIDYSALTIQHLQRFQWSPPVPELAVIVVFDDDSVPLRCPTQQLLASLHAQHCPCRKLPAGCYEQ